MKLQWCGLTPVNAYPDHLPVPVFPERTRPVYLALVYSYYASCFSLSAPAEHWLLLWEKGVRISWTPAADH